MMLRLPTITTFVATDAAAVVRAARRTALATVLLAFWLVGLGISWVRAADDQPGPSSQASVIRIGIGPGIWLGVNHNDATAAIRAWTKAILNLGEKSPDVETQVFETPAALGDALKRGQIDAATLLTGHFLGLPPEVQPDAVFLGTKGHAFTEHYVLLVHRDAGISEVAGLAGRKLVFQANARTSLALPWFDALLARHSLGSAETVLASLTKSDSPSKAVMKVFFRQADACLVTSNVFELACELNPQLRKELQVLAVSPAVVPALFFFRADYQSSLRAPMESAIVSMQKTPAGLEVLTVFQSDGMVRCPLTTLDGTRQLLAEYERSKSRPATGSSTNSTPPFSQR